MSRPSKSSKSNSSKNKSSEKKHTAVPPVAQAKTSATTKPVMAEISQAPVKAPEKAPVKATEATAPAAVVDSKVAAITGPSAAVEALITELQSNSGSVRLAAATELGRTGDRHAVSALIAALRDSDADVARESATALGLLDDRAAVDELVAILTDTNGYYHSVVRAAAASSLGQLKDTHAVEALLGAVTDPIAEPSVEAIRALAVLNDRRAIGTLLDVVRNASGFFAAPVRRAAVLALARFGGPEAIDQLRYVASDQWEDNVIRDEAQTAVNNASV